MKNKNDAKFIKGIVDDQLSREILRRNSYGYSEIKQPISREYCVDFNVVNLTDSINLLIDDIQNMTKVSCITMKLENNITMVRLC